MGGKGGCIKSKGLLLIKMNKELQTNEWYEALVEECKAIITEAVFTSRWALVEGYWTLGKTLREEENIKWHAKGSESFLQDLADNLNISIRTLHYALQAYDKFPELSKIPEGKAISWNKLITQYLPEPKKEKTPKLPEGKFNVIYADPPWCYGDKHDYNGTTGAETYYPSMTINQLCELPVISKVADNSVLFLWVTSPLLDECWPVIKAWGFEYKTSFVWDKVKHNMGHYNSVRHEFLLVCTRGSFIPETKKLFDSVVVEERSDTHSEKPHKFYEIIETLYPNGKYLELFARNKRKNWESWGNEI